MPRIPRKQLESSRRAPIGIPFTPTPQVSLGPLVQFGLQLKAAGDRAFRAEHETLTSNARLTSKKLLSQGLQEISLLQDEDVIQHAAAQIRQNVFDGVNLTVKDSPQDIKDNALLSVNADTLAFDLKVNELIVTRRTERAFANIAKTQTDALDLAKSARTQPERDVIFADVSSQISDAVSSGLLSVDKAQAMQAKMRNDIDITSLGATAREEARAFPDLFIVDADSGELERQGFPQGIINDSRALAQQILSRRDARASAVDKSTNQHTMDFFRGSARQGLLTGDVRDRAILAVEDGAITDVQLAELERLNSIRSSVAPDPATTNGIIARVFERPTPGTVKAAQAELDELVIGGFDRNSLAITQARRTLFGIEQRLATINASEVGRAIRRLRLAVESKVRLTGGNFLRSMESAAINRMFEEIFLSDDPMATSDNLASQIDRSPGIIGLPTSTNPEADKQSDESDLMESMK